MKALCARGFLAWWLLSALVACGDDEHGEEAHEEASPAAEACEHAVEGPFQPVTAALDPAQAPSATYRHHSVQIALVDVEGGKGGSVRFEADEEGDFSFFLSEDIPLEITDGAGVVVEIEASTPVDLCSEVAIQHVAGLSVGPYLLRFGPTSEASVSLVAEHGGEAHEHE